MKINNIKKETAALFLELQRLICSNIYKKVLIADYHLNVIRYLNHADQSLSVEKMIISLKSWNTPNLLFLGWQWVLFLNLFLDTTKKKCSIIALDEPKIGTITLEYHDNGDCIGRNHRRYC